MISISDVFGWAVSQERALVNARAASVECSRRRLERAEVEDYLERLLGVAGAWTEPRVAQHSG
jgi:hypothetical protein